MTAFTGFLPEVLPAVPGCPIPMAVNAIRNATIQLLQESSWLTNTPAAINIVANTSEYALTPPAGSLVADILWAAHNNQNLTAKTEAQLDMLSGTWRTDTGDPVYYTLLSPRLIRLVPTPTAALTGGLKLRYAAITEIIKDNDFMSPFH